MTKIVEEAIAPKLGDWWKYFNKYWQEGRFDTIHTELRKQAKSGISICPNSENTYKSFEVMDPSKLKVIWCLMDPYASVKDGVKVANGIAMDCSNTGVLQPSLKKFYDAIAISEENDDLEMPPSLSYLVEQGNMFINTALTVPQGANTAGQHMSIWRDFMKYFYEDVMSNFSSIVYILCGKPSETMEEYINSKGNYIFKLEHPSYAARQKRIWKFNNIFDSINKILKDNNGPAFQIEWDAKKYKLKQKEISQLTHEELEILVEECPF